MISKLSELQIHLCSVANGEETPEYGLNLIKESGLMNENIKLVCHIIADLVYPQKTSENALELIKLTAVYMESIGKKEEYYDSLLSCMNPSQLSIIGIREILDKDKVLEKLDPDMANVLRAAISPPDQKSLTEIILLSMERIPELQSCLRVDVDALRQVILNGTCEGSIKSIIKNDDVDALIAKQDDPSFDIHAEIWSNDLDVEQGSYKLIDYAAIYGSVKCFKYLLLNRKEDEEVISDEGYPIIGGNLEIIRILMEYGYEFNDSSSIENAIRANKMDIMNWIIDRNPKLLENPIVAASLVNIAIIMCNATAFDTLRKYVEPDLVFELTYPGDFYSPFYLTLINELDHDKMQDLFIKISNFRYSYFARQWFPIDLIDKSSFFNLIINCIKVRNNTNLSALLVQSPELSLEEEKEIYDIGKIGCIDILHGYERFWKFAELKFDDFKEKVENFDVSMLSFFNIPGFADKTDDEGNNYLQYLFKYVFTEERSYQMLDDLDVIVRSLAQNVDLKHKNNNGETAEDILVHREYTNATLVMQAVYREIVPEFPFQDFPVCTFKLSKRDYIPQPFYRCKTCGLVNHEGCCEACVSKCHKGHEIVYYGITNAFCDCPVKQHHDNTLFSEEITQEFVRENMNS